VKLDFMRAKYLMVTLGDHVSEPLLLSMQIIERQTPEWIEMRD
jgi:hypothetical protein